MNLIINELDPRYKYLDKLLSYDRSSIIYRGDGRNSVYYFIPPELVLEEYDTDKIQLRKSLTEWSWCNWIHGRSIPRILQDYCNITTEEFYNLIILHNNDLDNKPRCKYCNSDLWFKCLAYGYSTHNYKEGSSTIFCSISCHVNWMNENNLGMNSIDSNIRKARTQFLSKGTLEDECYLYITWLSNGKFKYGITSNLEDRIVLENLNGNSYNSIHILRIDSRVNIVDIELKLKYRFNGLEYLESKLLNNFFIELRIILTK